MMQFEITVHCPELETLAYALRDFKGQPVPSADVGNKLVYHRCDHTSPTDHLQSPRPEPEAAASAPLGPPSTSHAHAPSAPAPAPAPAYVAPPAPTAAAAPTYDKETLVRAAAELMDQGRQQDLLQLLARFNVPSMMALDPSQFAEFGAALKEIGGKL